MESIMNQQSQIMEAMNKLYINYKKDGPVRRTVQTIKSKLCTLDGYWQEFQNNHEKILESENEGFTYFSEKKYEKTKAFYQDVRNIFIQHLEIAEKGLIPPSIGDWASQGQSPKPRQPTPMATESNEEREPEPGPVRLQVHGQGVSDFTNSKIKSRCDDNKLQEMLKKQQSNFKAFARTLHFINVENISEQWELEDALQSIQSRWTIIDSLHWDIDSELGDENEDYNQSFYNYEQKFQDMKRRINSKKWSMSHRDKATPQMDIPTFSGNFHQWVSFKDLFNESIHSNRSMSNAQKMQFLKNKVRGEAEKLIQHLNISSENYEICWEILNHRYNNLKLIFSAHINNLLSIPTVQHQSYVQIKKLHDTTNECLNAIKNLGVDISSWDPLIVHILSQKLDTETHTEYVESLQNPRDLPTLKDFLNFLEMKFTSYESSRRKLDNPKPSQSESSKKPFYRSFGIKDQKNNDIRKSSFYQKNNCPVCDKNHGIFHCETFLGSKPDAKRRIVSKLNLCKNCLYNHYNKDCFSEKRCRTCNEKHNTLVHDAFVNASKMESTGETSNKQKISTNVAQENNFLEILLATALINVQSKDGSYHTLRALIDQGSQTSLITENAAQLLQLPRQRCKGVVYGIGAKGNNCKGIVTITASALRSDYELKFEAYVMNNLINNLPNKSFYKPSWSYLDGVPLADPDFNISRPVDLLLGADVYATIIQGGIIKESTRQPIAQQTKLGWILCGNVPSYQCNIIINNIEEIQRFWNIEDISEKSNLSTEDQHCLEFYKNSTLRQQNGRYEVRLPLLENAVLGTSKKTAIAQFLQLERKFQKQEDLARDYKAFIQEYISLGHMRDCTSAEHIDSNATPYYLPHHGVRRSESTTTSLRVVFNASAKTSNSRSLNDVMYCGPNLQQDLFSLIIKWRQFKVAFTADVEKMFRQINLNIKDQQYQRIIWRDSPHQPLREYALTTVTYGLKAAPFLAMMTLKQLAQDERHNYPEASKVVEESFYMDDVLHGSHEVESAKKLQRDLMALMTSGGFLLRKWASNRPELLEENSKSQDLQSTFEFKDQEITKTLGLRWHPHSDNFTFQLRIEPATESTNMSKRTLLSNISKVFDPLGWLTPVTTKLKLLFQKVVSQKMEWDDLVPEDVNKEWQIISNDLQHIKHIKIPRWLNTTKNQTIQLHGFCDASTKAYACIIYCRIINQDGQASEPIIVAAKSRLVPANKNITLPRLELCAALLLSSLMETVKNALSEVSIQTYGWSDSTAVLGWLQGNPSKWKPFVSNRVLKITKVMPADCWNYIKSEENPADSASRGIKAKNLKSLSLWWRGPAWLSSYETNQEKSIFITDQDIKINKQCHATTQYVQDNVITTILNRTSSMTHATRVVAWVLRMTSSRRRQQKPTYLTTDELRAARHKLIKYQQEMEFTDDINKLKNNQNLDSRSKLLTLKPFLDQDGMLRVGGRLVNANISWEKKHPLIIPHSSHLTDLLIDQAHKKTLHGGARLTLAQLRQDYWIIGGNRATKKHIRLCVTCRRQKPDKLCQIMGDLPESRSNPTRPFYNTGVDFTGFVNVKANKGRGIKTTKGYIAVFVCMATKAVHIELVSDLSSASFIAALRRLAARRGAPRHIFSDNGTNFVGANKILQKEFEEIRSTLDEQFFNTISDMNITWHFNAPSWPSAGGIWEIQVKSLKYHLCRVLGDQHLTFEEFSTLLAQIEGCLNARPLCALSEDPDDINYLTPSHFLSSGPTLSIIESERDERTRWRLTQKIFHDLWKRWQSEYLCQLQSRSKWALPKSNIKIDDVVIIHEPNLPAGKWALGRVIDVHPGKDGYIRVVTVKTKSGVLKRPIIKLSILPVSERQDDLKKINKNQEKPKENIESTTNKNRTTRHKNINIKTMALMFLMLIVTPVQCAYNISYFKNNQGIYFDKLSNIKLSRDEWKLVVFYDIDPYWQGIELFSKYISHLENICQKNNHISQCNVVLSQLQHGASELNYYNSMLLGQRTASSRKRRGLFNGVGNIARSLIGVLDEDFAVQYQKDIELIKTNENHLASLWKNQTSVIEAENNLLQRVDSTMDKQFKKFNQHLINLQKNSHQVSNQLQTLNEINEFAMSSIIANNIFTSLKGIQNILLDTITNVIYGKFNIHLLTPEQLKNELNIISGQVSKDLSLPYENINTDLPKLYQTMKVRTRMNQQLLIFEIKIPLVIRENYELYRLIPIPHQEGKNMISIIPISNQVAINMQKESFVPMTTHECVHFDIKTLICPLEGPIYQLKADNDLCVMDHITRKCKTDTAVCNNNWLEISAINTYIFFCCDQCPTRIICEQEVKAEYLHSAGILNLRKNCIIKGDSFTLFSQQVPSNNMNIQADVPLFDMPSINNVFNLTLPTIGNMNESYPGNEKLLEHIRQQIKQMKTEDALVNQVSYHDVHHYVAIYVVTSVLLVIVALYVRRCVTHRRRDRTLVTPPLHPTPETVAVQLQRLPPTPATESAPRVRFMTQHPSGSSHTPQQRRDSREEDHHHGSGRLSPRPYSSTTRRTSFEFSRVK